MEKRWSNLSKIENETLTVSDTDDQCGECGGEGVCDYGMGEDVKTMACEKCNPNGDHEDEDLAYDRMKDEEAEAYFDKLNDRD